MESIVANEEELYEHAVWNTWPLQNPVEVKNIPKNFSYIDRKEIIGRLSKPGDGNLMNTDRDPIPINCFYSLLK